MVGGDDGDATAQRRCNSNYDGRRWMVQRQHDGDNSDGARRRQWRRPNERWAATTATLWRDGDATATVMDDDGWYNGYTTAMMAMERGGNGNGAQTSNGRHRGMLARYGRASMHLELSSFGYKYGIPPTALGTASPTPAPSRPWTCVISTARPRARVKVQQPIVPGQAVPPEPAQKACEQQPPARLRRPLRR